MRRFGAPSCPERRFFSISFFLPQVDESGGGGHGVPAPERAPSTTGACCQLSPGRRHEEVRFAGCQIITVLQSVEAGRTTPGIYAASRASERHVLPMAERVRRVGRPGRQMEAFSWRFTSSSTSSGVCSRRKQRRFSTISALSLGRLAVKWSGFR